MYNYERIAELKQVEKTPAQEVYANVRYYRVRTREIIKQGVTTTTSTTKWSKYNDTSLLNDGYHYTGNYRIK